MLDEILRGVKWLMQWTLLWRNPMALIPNLEPCSIISFGVTVLLFMEISIFDIFELEKKNGGENVGKLIFFKKINLINNLSCLGFRFLLEKIAKAKSIPEDTVICHLRHSNCLTSLGGKSHFRCLKLHMWHSIEPQKTSHLDILGHYSPFFLVHFRPH